MSIRSKIMLILVLPLLGLIVMSVKSLMSDYTNIQTLKKLDVGVDLSTKLSLLVHETQKERGATAGFIGSKGVKFADKLPKQRLLTNKRLKELKEFLKENDISKIDKNINNNLNNLLNNLSKLDSIRSQVDNLSIKLPNALKYYTGANTQILNSIGDVVKISNSKEITNSLIAYSNFLLSKERAGIERAVGTATLAKDYFSTEMRIKFNNLISSQNSYMKTFLYFADTQTKEYYKKTLSGKSIDEVNKIRNTLLNSVKKMEIVSSMKDILGYGGFIHNFKNYVLRGTPKYLTRAEKQYFELMELSKKYKNLKGISQKELKYIKDIENTFTNYFNQLPKVQEAIKKGKSIKQLDKVVKVSDSPAINALHKLSNSLFSVKPNYWFEQITIKINKLKSIDDFIAKKLQKQIDEKQDETFNSMIFFLIINIIGIILVIAIAIYILGDIFKKLATLDEAVENLLTSNDVSSRIKVNSNDEIGKISTNFNNYLQNIQNEINEDNKLIQNAKDTIDKVIKGVYSENIQGTTSNTSLNDFKDTVNTMINETRQHFMDLNKILSQYSNYNYTNKLYLDNIEQGGAFDLLVKDINKLRDAISEMLVENKRDGVMLNDSANKLLGNVNILNNSSNEAAASLEETAAALEQITSNISNNTDNVVKMSGFAKELTVSSDEGEKLAQETTTSMDEINEQVTAINEAITVIDQIAFQTNILSLNAAVEAATAGEAGKGFAVVAGEVRNLAARSAEAANEIKTLVGNATQKANDGKHIADKMIDGYSTLNENITKTLELISDVEMASKEQLSGIEQINDSINNLDKQTQENANVASQAQDIANTTSAIASKIVESADKKEFDGKNEVDRRKNPLNTDYKGRERRNMESRIRQMAHDNTQSNDIKNVPTDPKEWESF